MFIIRNHFVPFELFFSPIFRAILRTWLLFRTCWNSNYIRKLLGNRLSRLYVNISAVSTVLILVYKIEFPLPILSQLYHNSITFRPIPNVLKCSKKRTFPQFYAICSVFPICINTDGKSPIRPILRRFLESYKFTCFFNNSDFWAFTCSLIYLINFVSICVLFLARNQTHSAL